MVDEVNIKQAAIQALFKALIYGRTEIAEMYYEATDDRVIAKTESGGYTVNVAGDSVMAMLCDVVDAVRRHEL